MALSGESNVCFASAPNSDHSALSGSLANSRSKETRSSVGSFAWICDIDFAPFGGDSSDWTVRDGRSLSVMRELHPHAKSANEVGSVSALRPCLWVRTVGMRSVGLDFEPIRAVCGGELISLVHGFLFA